MYLYTAHRAINKEYISYGQGHSYNKKQPTEQAHISYFFRPGLLLHSCTTQRAKWLHSTLTKHGHFYTQTQLREQSVHIIQAKAVHLNKLTEQTDYFLYWPWTATLTLKHNSQSEAYILELPQLLFLHNTYCQQRVHFILARTTLVHSYTIHKAKHFSIQVYM